MFDRFTDRARRVVGLSKAEAQRLNHGSIGTEHILLGLVAEGTGVAASVLKQMNVDLQRIRKEIEKIVEGSPNIVTQGNLPFTPRAKTVLLLAVEEASNLGHNYIGTEHLLLGLIAECEGVAARVLTNLGVEIGAVRGKVREFVGSSQAVAAPSSTACEKRPVSSSRNPFRRFTDRVHHALRLAKKEAKRMNHACVSSGHLLLGLVAEGSGVAWNVLQHRGIDLARARAAFERVAAGDLAIDAGGDLPFNQRANAAFELAAEEADRLGHAYIGTEHLLLGLLRDGEGIAANVLKDLAVDLGRTRTEILECLGVSPKSTDP